MNFAKFLRTPSLQNTSGQLLLNYYSGKTGGVSRVTFRNGEGPPELCDNL